MSARAVSREGSVAAAAGRLRRLGDDQSGAVMLEYLVVTFAGLMIAVALCGLGVALVDFFGPSLQVLHSEYP